MKLEDFTAITTQIAQNLSNQGLVTELLTKLNEDYTQETTNRDNLSKQVTDFTTQVDNLQKQNMNLFLKVGNQAPDEAIRKTETKLSYEDLFDEKGGLK